MKWSDAMTRVLFALMLFGPGCVTSLYQDKVSVGDDVGVGAPSDTPEDEPGVTPDQPPVAPPNDTGSGVPVDTGTTPTLTDSDGDGILDDTDNCPAIPNANQLDFDQDDEGDECDEDRDGDFIPNDADLFPDDGDRPGRASPDTIYAHGPNTLFEFSVGTQAVTLVGNFTFDSNSGSITDIAIDRHGVLYAVTFVDAFVCHPQQAECWHIGRLTGSHNGLSFVPSNVPGDPELLAGIANSGTWTAYEGVPFSLNARPLGAYSGGAGSSGDVYHINGIGTFGAVTGMGSGATIVETDNVGGILRTISNLDSVGGVYGLAGWDDYIYAFTSSGQVIAIDPITGQDLSVSSGHGSWWGAGVRTIITP
jgi:hypothetical protein